MYATTPLSVAWPLASTRDWGRNQFMPGVWHKYVVQSCVRTDQPGDQTEIRVIEGKVE
jgi:hypothetical protein